VAAAEVGVVPAVPKSGPTADSSQKLAFTPPPRSSWPRKPIRLLARPSRVSDLKVLPSPFFTALTPRSMTPNSVIDCADAPPAKAPSAATVIRAFLMVVISWVERIF
jgi:hypothetical protein